MSCVKGIIRWASCILYNYVLLSHTEICPQEGLTLKKITLLLIVWVACIGSTYASTYDPYVVRDSTRTAEATILLLEGSKYFWQFQEELQKSTGLHYGHLTEAVERGALRVRPCGNCRLETAGIRSGTSVYHRHVRPEEPVAYLGDIPVFLPACGNPVRSLNRAPAVVVPLPTPEPPPQPVVRGTDPPQEGCTEGAVWYTSGHWENLGTWGFWN